MSQKNQSAELSENFRRDCLESQTNPLKTRKTCIDV